MATGFTKEAECLPEPHDRHDALGGVGRKITSDHKQQKNPRVNIRVKVSRGVVK